MSPGSERRICRASNSAGLAASPGEIEVVIELATSSGRRRLKLGPDYRVTRTAGLRAQLDQLLGPALIASPQAGVAA